jgi:hypothetical protein
LKFHHALKDGAPVSSKLAVKVLFRRGRYFPEFIFPVDTAGFIVDHQLLASAYEANGIMFPKLISFPSYSGAFSDNDSSLTYSFIVLRLDIDSTGALTNVQVAGSTYPDFDVQLQSASLYATFAPATINGHPAASVAYLVVSFFPQLRYPLKSWELSNYPEMSPQKKATVRLLADTVGIICPPVPRRHAGEIVIVPGLHNRFSYSTSYTLKIDTLGRAGYFLEKKILPRGRAAMKQIKKMITYFPAMTMGGHPAYYEGPARFHFSGSINVRVEYLWLKIP